MTFEEAKEKAKNKNPKYNVCIEHENAWIFLYNDGNEYGTTGLVIMKKDGRMLMPNQYYFTDVGDGEIIREIRV